MIFRFCLKFLTAMFLFFAVQPYCSAAEPSPLPLFTKNDRVLILAPHPDDETLGAGGVINSALKAGAQVKVVLLTDGENNKLAFTIHLKRIVWRGKTALKMGALRRRETVNAMGLLGLEEENIIALGYPDFGILKILTKYWNTKKTYRSLAAHVRHVPSPDHYSPGAPYTGESILADLRDIFSDFQPTKIFVSHPADENRDHRALYLFTRIALWDLENQFEAPEIYPYLIHLDGWPAVKGYLPGFNQIRPLELRNSDIEWNELELNSGEAGLKYEAVQKYTSQIEYSEDFLNAYARMSELFGDYPAVYLPAHPEESEPEWIELNTYNPVMQTQKTAQQKFIASVAYAREGDRLHVKLKLKYLRNRIIGVTVSCLGYKRGTDFSEMPKVEFFMRLNRLSVKDKKKRISKKGIRFIHKGKELRLSIPLSLLGNPDYILSSAKTRRAFDMYVDETAWRILSVGGEAV